MRISLPLLPPHLLPVHIPELRVLRHVVARREHLFLSAMTHA